MLKEYTKHIKVQLSYRNHLHGFIQKVILLQLLGINGRLDTCMTKGIDVLRIVQQLKKIGRSRVSTLAKTYSTILDSSFTKNVSLFFALIVSFSIIFPFSHGSAITYVCPNHIGSMFKMAIDVADGLTLYGQTYSQYGPIPTWIQAIALSIFGRNVIVSAMTTMVFALANIFVLQCVWNRILPYSYVVIAIILQAIIQPDISLPWPNAYLAFFSACTLFAIISYLEKSSVKKLFFAGLCTAAGILCRQQGIMVFLFVFICLLFLLNQPHKTIYNKILAAFWYFLGTSLPIATYLLYLQSKHMLVDFYKQTILIIPIAYTSGNLSILDHLKGLINNFFAPDRLFFISLWGIIALICSCYMLILMFKNSLNNPTGRALFLCSGFALIGLLNAYPLPDDFRYALGMAPATGVIIYLLYTTFSIIKAPLRLICVLLVLYILFNPAIVYFNTHYHDSMRLLKKGTLEGYIKINVPSEIAGTYHTVENVQFYTKLDKLLNQYMKLYPNTSFISLGVEPLFLTFVPHNKNAHQMPFLWWSKTGSMHDNGRNNTINALLYPDYFAKLQDFIAHNKPILYTYGQPIKGYKPIFENTGGVGFPLYWANQWIARPIVSIQAPIDRANHFLASTDSTEFFTAPERVIISKILSNASNQVHTIYPIENVFDSRLDSFISYTSNVSFELTLNLQLLKPYLVSKISLYPRGGYEKVLPRYLMISGSLDGTNWHPIIASFTDTINATQTGSVFTFNPEKLHFLKISMKSLDQGKEQCVQIAEIILN